MTREMNKPDWHNKWVKLDKGGSILYWSPPKQRVLDEWIKPFFERCCKMERLK